MTEDDKTVTSVVVTSLYHIYNICYIYRLIYHLTYHLPLSCRPRLQINPPPIPRWPTTTSKTSANTANLSSVVSLTFFRFDANHARAGEWARRRGGLNGTASTVPSRLSPKPTVYNSAQCSHPSCKTLIHTMANAGVHCQNCHREYCLSHRMREDHDCSNLTPLGASPASVAFTSSADKARQAFSRLRSWGKTKSSAATTSIVPKSKPKPNSAASRMAHLNTLKKNAKGDSNLDVSKRFYLHVEASADTTTAKYPTGDFYYDKGWSVGKILDDAARKLQVQNVNNRTAGEEDRLRIFHVEGGKLLDFSNKIGSCSVAQGDTIVLLRGVGPPVPDLIEM
ncbi:AN1-type zinc finger protein 1 [Arthroderma uncinatum]|uniref:AN1-type zinc finger protein 1 n=1 Tax=Arthroderma uncinatum TaxID=74035 RepID=UPI00144AC376|nr:AN1-type zinc finger protein 1 [Arthroderma uncinatum]KAF3480784.1 AN1-type zinc finger protein 1 [Arthroderma uncinatum]